MARRNRNVTIHDVASAAGVSVSTVSRVLNNRDDVSEDTFARVQDVINELGYSSSLAARSMRSRKTNVIGVLVPDMEQPFSVEMLRGISASVREAGYDLLAYLSAVRPADALGSWEQRQVSLLNGSVVDGIIVVTPHADNFRTTHPLVAIDPHSDSTHFPSVISTNRIGVMDGMQYLLDLGHRRIGYVGGRLDLESGHRRLRGYMDALKLRGIPYDEALVVDGDYTRPSGHEGGRSLLTLDARPTAIFASNDDAAIGVMEAAAELGIRVPHDLSVVGFDNVPEAAAARPPLTTVDQSIAEMGVIAMNMLLTLIRKEPLLEHRHKVPTRLIVRDSTAAPGAGG